MAFGAGPGTITDGLGADSWKAGVPLRFNIGAGQSLVKGQALRRNLLSVAGRNDLYPQYSAGDVGVLPTSASAGFVAGVYTGPTQSNSNSVAQNTGIYVARQGVVPVRAAALNGGTAVTVGSLIGFSAATGASSFDVPTIQTYTIGAVLGYVTGYQIQTALAAAVAGAGSATVAVSNTDGITTATALTVDYGQGIQETVTPSAVTAQVKANGNIAIAGTFAAGAVLTATVNGVAVSYTVVSGDTTNAGAAASFAKVINASLIVQGINAVVGPAVVSSATIYFTALNPGTPSNTITLTASATSTMTATASGATFSGGTYGTITATFLNPHASGAKLLGQNLVSGSTIIPVPAATGGININTVLVDLALVGA